MTAWLDVAAIAVFLGVVAVAALVDQWLCRREIERHDVDAS